MKHIYTCIIFLAIVSLTACSNPSNEPQQITDHVLTILARDRYESPIRQAERNLIEEWAQRPEKEGHTFTIELTTFPPEDELNQLTRLDTKLMAGQGYDIFFPVTDHRHIRDYAQSGFITDIHPLIESCPHTNINDFFINVLQAWEIDDSLYVFPWDFTFNYAFINSALPQKTLNDFTQLNTVTVAQLVDIYSDILRYYEHDFGHFSFSHGSTLHHPSRILISYMSNFIDFNSRTANLTDETFITFLTEFISTFDGQHVQGQDRQYWTNWWTSYSDFAGTAHGFNSHSLRMIARGANSFTWGTGFLAQWRWDTIMTVTMAPHTFLVESRDFFPAAAVLHENVFWPYFEHGIPLVDNNGYLLIADNTSYPAGISISSTANGAVAWDFTRHLVNAFNKREMHSRYMLFYNYSLSIPITRDLFSFRIASSLQNAYEFYIGWRMFSFNFNTSGTWSTDYDYAISQIPAMAQQIYERSNQPMALTRPPIPDFLYVDNLELLLRGLITPQDFAQRTQNAVSLWLIGG